MIGSGEHELSWLPPRRVNWRRAEDPDLHPTREDAQRLVCRMATLRLFATGKVTGNYGGPKHKAIICLTS